MPPLSIVLYLYFGKKSKKKEMRGCLFFHDILIRFSVRGRCSNHLKRWISCYYLVSVLFNGKRVCLKQRKSLFSHGVINEEQKPLLLLRYLTFLRKRQRVESKHVTGSPTKFLSGRLLTYFILQNKKCDM